MRRVGEYIASVDQGTASSRCLIFDSSARVVSVSQKEHHHIFPRPGWVEHDPQEIRANVLRVVHGALKDADLRPADLVALGITNQRETTVLVDRACAAARPTTPSTGRTLRTDRLVREFAAGGGQDRFKELCGLPLATYFSGPKIRWLLDKLPGLRERAESGDVLFGTIELRLIWNLTGRHVTDPTNASRTMLMSLHTLDWDDTLLDAFGVPRAMLPEIRSSSEVYGHADALDGLPVASALGDQSAALFGQTCFSKGDAKCTYGTGSFLLMNTGAAPVQSTHGLADHGRLQDRRAGGDLRTRRLDRRHGRARAVVPRQPRGDRERARDRDARALGRGQRRLLLRRPPSPARRRTGAATRAA